MHLQAALITHQNQFFREVVAAQQINGVLRPRIILNTNLWGTMKRTDLKLIQLLQQLLKLLNKKKRKVIKRRVRGSNQVALLQVLLRVSQKPIRRKKNQRNLRRKLRQMMSTFLILTLNPPSNNQLSTSYLSLHSSNRHLQQLKAYSISYLHLNSNLLWLLLHSLSFSRMLNNSNNLCTILQVNHNYPLSYQHFTPPNNKLLLHLSSNNLVTSLS